MFDPTSVISLSVNDSKTVKTAPTKEEMIAKIDGEIESLKKQYAEVKGNETEIFARVCGYFAPVEIFNKGKKEEYKNRKEFNQPKEEKTESKIDYGLKHQKVYDVKMEEEAFASLLVVAEAM
jgi:ribonucleoside-triphosphate reductase